ncbi:MAG: DUF4129 domain-containing protein [Pseudomonadota bacterium]
MPSVTRAQEAVQEPVELSESGEAYLRALRFRRIDTDVAYFDPNAPAPDLDTEVEPPAPLDENGRVVRGVDVPTMLISGAILAAILYLFIRFGGAFSVSLGRDAENAAREGEAEWTHENAPNLPGSLDAILKIKDRRQAIVLLAQKVLATAIAANGILFQKSWTGREALRRLPQDQTALDAIRALVLASERVQFGGRDISEDEFGSHLTGIRPLLGGSGV